MNTNRTFAELITAVQTEMQLDPGLISETERKQFINDALADVGDLGMFEKSDTIAVTGGVATLPDDLVQVITVRWQDGRVLKPSTLTHGNYESMNPVYFTQKFSELSLFPQVDGTIDLYYAYRPAKLVNTDDQPDIPNGYDSMIVDYAVSRAHRKNGNFGVAREYMASYETYKMRLSNELIRRANSRVVDTINQQGPTVDPIDLFRFS